MPPGLVEGDGNGNSGAPRHGGEQAAGAALGGDGDPWASQGGGVGPSREAGWVGGKQASYLWGQQTGLLKWPGSGGGDTESSK